MPQIGICPYTGSSAGDWSTYTEDYSALQIWYG
jgi:hypothetical protein